MLQQIDTFFNVPRGRLKLRQIVDLGELIYYQRADEPGPKLSTYTLMPIHEPEAMRQLLARALGVFGEVRKCRGVYLVGQSRIHLDSVEGLGEFLEVEVVLKDGQAESDGEAIALGLQRDLEVADEDLIQAAYVDLV